jgi:hypothetical protein
LEGEWDVNGNGEYGEGDEWSLITYTPDVFVGRLPIPSTYRLNQFVDKLLAYEAGPPDDYHPTPFLSLAGYDDEENGTGWMGDEILGNLPPGMDQENDIIRMYDSFYDGDYFSYTIDRDLVLQGPNSLNEGYFGIHHGGHGGSTLISVASDHTLSEVDRVWYDDLMGLTNFPKFGIFYSFGCNTSPLDAIYNNFGWQWIIPDFEGAGPDDPGGGIAYIGSTGRSWGNPNYGHVLLDRLFWTSLSEPFDVWVGQALAEAKLRKAVLYPPSAHKHWAWILVAVNGFFCSPTPIWFQEPEMMMEQHEAQTTPGDFEVEVRDLGGHPIQGGLRTCVCLRDPDAEVYEIEFTGTDGDAIFTIEEPSTYPCTVKVTVTRTAFNIYQQLDQYEPIESYTIVSPCGDANGDSEVTPGDGYHILNYFGSGPEPSFCRGANVNGDGSLTPGDGYHLLNHFGSGPELDCQPCELASTLWDRIRAEE